MNKIEYQPAGRCIYCGCTAGKLSTEHVLAKSLGGRWELPRASCELCAAWTSQFERVVARDFYGVLRTTVNYPTRNKKQRPKTYTLDVKSVDGSERKVVVPAEGHPSIFPVVTLPLAGILTGAPLSESNPEMHVGIGMDDPAEMDRLNGLLRSGDTVSLPVRMDFYNFSLTLAKTAHAFVVANLGFDGYEPFLPDVVRGINPYRSHFVGGWPHPIVGNVGNPLLGLTITAHMGYIMVLIKLFHGRLDTFGVVAGRTTDPNLLGNAQQNSRIVGQSDFMQMTPFWEDNLSSSKSPAARVKRI